MSSSVSPSAERKSLSETCEDISIPRPPLEDKTTTIEGPSTSSDASTIAQSTINTKRKRLARLVSKETIAGLEKESYCSSSTMQGAADFDAQVAPHRAKGLLSPPPLPNPLKDPKMQKMHTKSLRLEAEIHPVRLILTRLMGHQVYNRRGIFNVPVDAEALGLLDYHQVIQKPMDLGTIKRRLHAIAYPSRAEAVEDIRLVFLNAMRYNRPPHPIHEAAKCMLTYFEQALMSVEDNHQEKSTTILVPSAPVPPVLSQAPPGATSEDIAIEDIPTVEPLVITKKTSKLPPFLPHECGSCRGRTCKVCQQRCLLHEPALMVCHGVHCGGARLRKGAMYYVTADGQQHFCERCYTNLQPILSGCTEDDPCKYKQDLLKRMNHEEIPEPWLECSGCSAGVHSICAMHSNHTHEPSDFFCHDCQQEAPSPNRETGVGEANGENDSHTFVSGSDIPVPMSSISSTFEATAAKSLPECSISAFIQAKIAKRLSCSVPNADKTITVRVISESSRFFAVPEVIRQHFCMATKSSPDVVSPPRKVNYRQKAIALFQTIDGLDVFIFCMYVQEYDGEDDYEAAVDRSSVESRHAKRVYISYIDSVEHFRPRDVRTEVYHEILVSYLATARIRGYKKAHIWACPPSRGNSFVFWNHPASHRTPNQERLLQWYHRALSKALDSGVVTNISSLYESEFERSLAELEESKRGRMMCPPLFDGDFWVEEAVRVHSVTKARNVKIRAPTEVCVWNVTPLLSSELDPCPALQIATLIKDRVMTHPASVHFRRPVNAAALKLKNYHKIVTRPMDLGTIYAQCVIGEYFQLSQVVEDFELMVSNAKRFNPVGHYVHTKADELSVLFYQELSSVIQIWDSSTGAKEPSKSWEVYSDMKMNLDERMKIASPVSNSVFIEDDRSADGTHSVNSASVFSLRSVPSSPIASIATLKDDDSKKEAQALPKPKRRRSINIGGRRRKQKRRGSLQPPKARPTPQQLDLLTDGPEAVAQIMVGQDYWMFERRQAQANGNKKRRSLSCASGDEASSGDEPSTKRRRQAWIGDEVSQSVRRLRTCFFTCTLTPNISISEVEKSKLSLFEAYVSDFEHAKPAQSSLSSPISENRHIFLEFSQYRNFEFDTLRRAKYSTRWLLYHLKNSGARGVLPSCSTCNKNIEDVRWHKVKKATEKRRLTKFMKPVSPEPIFIQQELCGPCHANHPLKDEFIPIPLSLKK